MPGHRAVISFGCFSVYSSISRDVPYISPTFLANSEKAKNGNGVEEVGPRGNPVPWLEKPSLPAPAEPGIKALVVATR